MGPDYSREKVEAILDMFSELIRDRKEPQKPQTINYVVGVETDSGVF